MNEPLPSRGALRWWCASALSVSGLSASDRIAVELERPCGTDCASSRPPSSVDCLLYREIDLSNGNAGRVANTKMPACIVAATPSADSRRALSRAGVTRMDTQFARRATWQGRNREAGTLLRVRSAMGELA